MSCHDDFDDLLHSTQMDIRRHITLTNKEDGVLYMTNNQLYFRDNVTDLVYDVFTLAGWTPYQVTLKGDTIYYLDESGKIRLFNVFTKKGTTFSTVFKEGEQIAAFSIGGDRIFYLAGEGCPSPGKCSLDLYEYNADVNTSNLISENLNAKEIIGYSDAENSVYIANWIVGYGDYFWESIYKIDLSDGEAEEVIEYEGVEIDKYTEAKNIRNKYTHIATSTKYLR